MTCSLVRVVFVCPSENFQPTCLPFSLLMESDMGLNCSEKLNSELSGSMTGKLFPNTMFAIVSSHAVILVLRTERCLG